MRFEIYDYCFIAVMILLVVIACIVTAMLTEWNLKNSWKAEEDITDDEKNAFIEKWATEFLIPRKGRK